ncbi:hypothetical protein BGZ88_005271, partial [Linnemannia elongata]
MSAYTTTLGGIDDELTEIRHIVTTKDDVARLWGCEPEQINILCLDLGQAFPFAASAILQPPETLHMDSQQHAMDISMRQLPGTDEDDAGDEVKNGTVLFHNLMVKQKAVYQPTFKVLRWLNQRKKKPVKNDQSISSIERDLPASRGPDGSLTRYLNQLKDVESILSSFYTDMVLKKNQWNARRTRDEEFNLMATHLLSMIGGTLGARRDPNNKVIIGIGLGEFSTTSRLTSLHTVFAKYFVQLVRSPGYIVVGINEFHTSKKCPLCHEFVCQVDLRRLYCPKCKPTCTATLQRPIICVTWSRATSFINNFRFICSLLIKMDAIRGWRRTATLQALRTIEFPRGKPLRIGSIPIRQEG